MSIKFEKRKRTSLFCVGMTSYVPDKGSFKSLGLKMKTCVEQSYRQTMMDVNKKMIFVVVKPPRFRHHFFFTPAKQPILSDTFTF